MVTALLDVSWGSNQGLHHLFPPDLYPVERGLTILEKIVRAGERIFQRTFSLGLISCLGSEITLTAMLMEHYHTTGSFIEIFHLILTTAQWDRLDNPSFTNRGSEVSEIHKRLQMTGFEAERTHIILELFTILTGHVPFAWNQIEYFVPGRTPWNGQRCPHCYHQIRKGKFIIDTRIIKSRQYKEVMSTRGNCWLWANDLLLWFPPHEERARARALH